MKPVHCYFLATTGCKTRIKIGVTNNLEQRLITHQTSNSHKVYYIHTEVFDSRVEAEAFAKNIERNSPKPFDGGSEWVLLNELLLLFILRSKELKYAFIEDSTILMELLNYVLTHNSSSSNKVYITPYILSSLFYSLTNRKVALSKLNKFLTQVEDVVKEHHRVYNIEGNANNTYGGKPIVGYVLPQYIDININN